ncbi:hypothetical protein F0342_06860 [Bacillus sp. CH30_1T]|uniref:hypothetical protein n=1 Tax=Bacillus sp. CH30_1T TaxID=2604836 RepID=UPI0011EBA20F|nr:hypothetical protein [Bacillus sp. CH30_1T]KAA0565323.1 hypothetical protein F0342_06860 [Bacillus sp. CH30_1T]
MHNDALVEVRLIHDLNDEKGELIFSKTKKELIEDGFAESDWNGFRLGDSFTLTNKSNETKVRVYSTEYDISDERSPHTYLVIIDDGKPIPAKI